MSIQSIRDLLTQEIPDLHSAERQVLDLLPFLIDQSSDHPLRQALLELQQLTRDQRGRLETMAPELRIELDGVTCLGMAGIVEEARALTADAEKGAIRDAAIISAVQKVEHYQIAAYGAAASYARLVGEEDIADQLAHTLEEEQGADRRLTALAEGFVNERAVGGRQEAR
jgi:ferritin-like metal-binding protein YciE